MEWQHWEWVDGCATVMSCTCCRLLAGHELLLVFRNHPPRHSLRELGSGVSTSTQLVVHETGWCVAPSTPFAIQASMRRRIIENSASHRSLNTIREKLVRNSVFENPKLSFQMVWHAPSCTWNMIITIGLCNKSRRQHRRNFDCSRVQLRFERCGGWFKWRVRAPFPSCCGLRPLTHIYHPLRGRCSNS